MKYTLSAAAAALLSLGPLVAAAQRLTATQLGCPLDVSAHVAAQVACGNSHTVAFAVEWHGADVARLEKWFRLAGCADAEAAVEAVRVVERCQTGAVLKDLGDDNLELRLEARRTPARRLFGRRTLDLEARVHDERAPDDDDDDDADDADADDSTTTTTSAETTTLATSTTSTPTITSTASATSSNPYVVTRTSGSSTSTLTCMTMTTTTATYCSMHEADKHNVKTCVTQPVSLPTCLPGLSCAFSQTTGTLSCYQKQGMPLVGKIILGIMGLAAALALSAILTLCCRERSQVKRHRQAAEEKALLAAMGSSHNHHNHNHHNDGDNKTAGVTTAEAFGFGTATPQPSAGADAGAQHSDDTAPLIRAEEEEESAHATTTTTTAAAPHIVVSGEHTPTDGPASFPPGNYDPFADDHHHNHRY